MGGFTGLSIALMGPGVPASARGPPIASGALALPTPTAGLPEAAVVAAEVGLVALAALEGAAEAVPFAVVPAPAPAAPPPTAPAPFADAPPAIAVVFVAPVASAALVSPPAAL